MASFNMREAQRTTQGWAARDQSGLLSPHSYVLRNTGPEDVFFKVICCGICHTDVHLAKNDFGISNYPMVPGHEIVGKVVEIGQEVSKVKVGDYVGVGFLVGSCKKCELCKSDYEQYCDKKITTNNDKHIDGSPTQGGYANEMVVDQRFIIKIPSGMTPEQAAPLMCAGVTAYSPLIRLGLNKTGLKGGILGLGGIGHMGVIVTKAMGHHVTVISSSNKKKQEALQHLGANEYIVSSDTSHMLEAASSLDYILDTLPVFHPLEPYTNLLKPHGKLVVLGAIDVPLQFLSVALLTRGITIAGSFMGSVKETEELMKLFVEKELSSKIEVIKMDYVDTAFDRLQKNDVRYKFVIDVAGSNLDR